MNETVKKVEKVIEIEMKNGSKKFLADLTQGDLANVKLNEKNGLTYLTMKSEVIARDSTHETERRLFKWNVMGEIKMYDLTVGINLDILGKELGKETVYNHARRNYVIEQDKVHNGIVATGKPADQKMLDLAGKMGLDTAGIEALKAIMVKAGFGK